jgi:hypothetical protein
MMNSKGTWDGVLSVSPRFRLPGGLGWTALGWCLVVTGCGTAPEAGTAAGGVKVTSKTQALVVAGDQSLRTLGKCVDVPGWNDANGTQPQLYDCNGGTNQQWEFWDDGTVRPTFNTSKCLDLPGWETANGTPIQIYDCDGGSNQQWTLGYDGTFTGYGGKCINVPGFQSANGTTLQYYDCSGTTYQTNEKFVLAAPVQSGSTFWNLKAEDENTGPDQEMCLGIAGGVQNGGLQPGTPAIVWDCNGSPDQVWSRTFQSDPTAQSGVMNFVDSAIFPSSNGQQYPMCLETADNVWSPDNTPDGGQLGAGYCPQYEGVGTTEDFILSYVQNDAFGYPCYTIQNSGSGLYVGVANAQDNPVQNGMAVILWDRTDSEDQIWCDHSANTETFTLTPDFVVTSVIYTPPGKSSNIQYQNTTSVGSSLSTTKSFQNSTDVTASASYSPMMSPFMVSASVTANHTFGDSDTHQVDLTTTWTQGYKKFGETDGIDHDWDEIWFMIHPILNMTFTPQIAGGPETTNWQFGQGDGTTTDIIYFAYAGELNGDMPMDQQLQSLFASNGITPDMYQGILEADAFFQGLSPQQGTSTPRFDYIGEFPYQPPASPLGQGQMPSTQTYGVSQSSNTSDTSTSSYSNSVGFTVSGSADFKVFKASLSVSSKWTWSHSTSKKDSTGTGSTDTLTVAQPTYGYAGPGLLHVYEDRIFKTYAYTLDYAGAVPFTYDGGYQCEVGGVGMHCCPPGNAMVGIRLDQNVFKCAPLQDPSGPIIADDSTYRTVTNPDPDDSSYTLHTCPFGYVMVGLRDDMNILACQQIVPNAISDSITGELVDTGTQDGYLHACESAPYAYAMSGFDGANNLLTCATNPGLK